MAFKMKGPSIHKGTARHKSQIKAHQKQLRLNRSMDNTSLPDGRSKSSPFQENKEEKTIKKDAATQDPFWNATAVTAANGDTTLLPTKPKYSAPDSPPVNPVKDKSSAFPYVKSSTFRNEEVEEVFTAQGKEIKNVDEGEQPIGRFPGDIDVSAKSESWKSAISGISADMSKQEAIDYAKDVNLSAKSRKDRLGKIDAIKQWKSLQPKAVEQPTKSTEETSVTEDPIRPPTKDEIHSFYYAGTTGFASPEEGGPQVLSPERDLEIAKYFQQKAKKMGAFGSEQEYLESIEESRRESEEWYKHGDRAKWAAKQAKIESLQNEPIQKRSNLRYSLPRRKNQKN
tara:strand:+ start:40 stop:1062 length:1023 start_codon:yes stop_codon:yes gene_type:complete